jgi:hydrogenase-4 component B
MTALLLAGVAALLAGSLLPLHPRSNAPALPLQALGGALLATGAVILLARGESVGAGFSSDVRPSFGLDGLSAFFVVLVGAAAVPACLAARDSLARSPVRRPLVALTGAFVLALAALPAARDVTTFLGLWELMTLLPAAAILVARPDAAVRRVVFVYLAVTHIGGAGVWVAVLALAQHGALGGHLAPGGPEALIVVAALVGFGTKAGLAPLHAWLPRAHPVAPAHLSALMSAVMLKVALYGLIRVLFEWTGPSAAAGYALLGLGALSAVGGALYALLQDELKRLLAFSSVENVGIVALGLGASLVLDGPWAALAFGAALLHTANHAAFKTLLFLGAGAFADAAGRLELDRLGGLLRRMPWTAGAFAVGCAAIAAVPPLNGFTSEWLTLHALLALTAGEATGSAVAGALALAALGLTAGLALMAFAKVAGMALLGTPRSPEAAAAVEAPAGTRAALLLPAAGCIALAVAAGPLLGVLAGLHPSGGAASPGLALDLPGTGGLAPLGLLAGLALLTVVLTRVTGAAPRAAAAPAWACGQSAHPAMAWTSAGFTKTLRLVLEPALRPRRDVTTRTSGAVISEITHRSTTPHLFDTLLYRPALRLSLRAARSARRMQSGSLRLYLSYLLALVLVLLALVRWGSLT